MILKERQRRAMQIFFEIKKTDRLKSLVVLALILFFGCNGSSSDKALGQNGNVLSWLQEARRVPVLDSGEAGHPDAPALTTLTEKTGRRTLYSRVLLIPPGRDLDLKVKGGAYAKMIFRARSLTGDGCRVEFKQGKWPGYRSIAAFDFAAAWRCATLTFPSFSGKEERIRISNPSRATAALSAVYFLPGDRPPPRGVALLVFDGLRRDALGAYGYGRPTSPRLDAFAREHVIFNKALSAGPQTVWSVLQMLTSCWGPFEINEGQKVADDRLLLPEELQRQGCITVGISENPLIASVHNLNQGYDLYVEVDADDQDRSTSPEAALAAIREVMPLLRQTGFFFHVHFLKPHYPYLPSREGFAPFAFPYRGTIRASRASQASYIQHPFSTLSPADKRQVRALYDGSIRDCDAAFAAVRDEMKSAGILKRTLLAVTADHGELFGEHEGYRAYGHSMMCAGTGHPLFLFQATLAVPLMVSFPGDRPTAVDQPVSLIDLFPSFFDFLDIHASVRFQGKSLLPLVAGKEWPQRPLYATCHSSQGIAVALVDGNDKAVQYFTRQGRKWVARESGAYVVSDFSRDGESRLTAGEQRRLFERIALFLKRQLRLVGRQGTPVSRNLSAEQVSRLKALGYLQ